MYLSESLTPVMNWSGSSSPFQTVPSSSFIVSANLCCSIRYYIEDYMDYIDTIYSFIGCTDLPPLPPVPPVEKVLIHHPTTSPLLNILCNVYSFLVY